MKIADLSEMKKGWFVGNFEPTLCRTNELEIAVKEYKKGDMEQAHYHKIATEVTAIIAGRVRMFDKIWEEGDIVVAEPGDITAFEALEDSINIVVKIPGANNDKYIVCEEK